MLLSRRSPEPLIRCEDWGLEDPAGKDLDTVRCVRDDIKQRVRTLLADLGM